MLVAVLVIRPAGKLRYRTILLTPTATGKDFVTIEQPEALVCAVLRREAPAWPWPGDAAAIARFLEAGRRHGVVPLLHVEFRSGRDFSTWPAEVLETCHRVTMAQTVWELAHQAEIDRVLQALSDAGARPLVLKGGALAHSHYPDAMLRTRGDTDLLIPLHQREAAYRSLEELGYALRPGSAGTLISYQSAWTRTDRRGAFHRLDVHWRINNSQMLARKLGYDELAARAVSLPGIGPHALALAPVDALLLACIHRAGHVNAPFVAPDAAHPEENRLIWLYDIHLLATGMSAEELDAFAARAAAKQLRGICLEGLLRARERFATPLSPAVLEALAAPGPVELSARYLSGGKIRQMVGDFLALEGWADRLQWLREIAFPSAVHMRRKYPGAAVSWLPVLYVRRGLRAVWRLITARGAPRGH